MQLNIRCSLHGWPNRISLLRQELFSIDQPTSPYASLTPILPHLTTCMPAYATPQCLFPTTDVMMRLPSCFPKFMAPTRPHDQPYAPGGAKHQLGTSINAERPGLFNYVSILITNTINACAHAAIKRLLTHRKFQVPASRADFATYTCYTNAKTCPCS